MVDPKKDYELLMRYLQGGAQKREPAAAPEQNNTQAWRPPTPDTTEPLHETAAPRPAYLAPKKILFHWPTWKVRALRRNGRIAIAALSLLILTLLIWRGYTFYQLSPDTIYKQVYLPFQITDVNSEATITKNSIAQYYASGNYVAATLQAKKQKQLLDSEKLLAGLSYLQREDYPNAIKWLEPLSTNFKSQCRQQAEFYVALAYLKNEDYDHCIERMENITYTPTHPYHDRISKDIISDIKMLKWK